MKYLYQFGIILCVTFLGEVMRVILPFSIPSSIYGLIIMLICLKTKIIKLEMVKNVGNFLLEIMPIMFIPAAVGILTTWNELKGVWFPILVITVLTTVLVMVVTGKTAQHILKRSSKEDSKI